LLGIPQSKIERLLQTAIHMLRQSTTETH
jgi:hypothetical protein